jgi:SOS-response transcriptional repressor LexA
MASQWEGERRTLCPYCHGEGFAPVPATLTRAQHMIYQYLRDYIAAMGYAPSFEEIAANFGYSSLGTVHEHLSNLERKGYIARRYNESRAIECLVVDRRETAGNLEEH